MFMLMADPSRLGSLVGAQSVVCRLLLIPTATIASWLGAPSEQEPY
jgi:hypothetical protein